MGSLHTYIRTHRLPMEYCYGCMALFQTILHNIFLLYHVDLFVSVYKIDKKSFWIGETIFLIWNSINDPLFGWISDRNYLSSSSKKSSKSKEGLGSYEIINNRLQALMYNGPLFVISFMLIWFPWGYPGYQFVVCLCLYDSFLTMIDLHHSALLADLTVSADMRASLNAKSSVFSAAGSASVFLSYAFFNKDNLDTFRMFCFLLAVFSFVGFILAAKFMQEEYSMKKTLFSYDQANMDSTRVEFWESPDAGHSVTSNTNNKTLHNFISQLKNHRNFKWFVAMNLVQVFHCHFNSNFFPLFLENLLSELISPWFGSFLIGISFLAPHINNLFFLGLCRKYGTYHVIQILFAIKLLISLLMFAIGPSSTVFLCLFIASNRVFTEGTCKLLNLVISDLVDEDFVIHNRKRAVSALIFGSTALLSKPGQTLAPLIGTWLLAFQTGHDVFETGNEVGSMHIDTSHMSPEMVDLHKQGCFSLLVYIPIVCAVIQLLVWSQFTLHGSRLSWIKNRRNDTTSSIL